MRANPTKRIEQYRVTTGPMASHAGLGPNGARQRMRKDKVHGS